jgi:hypothetical protein
LARSPSRLVRRNGSGVTAAIAAENGSGKLIAQPKEHPRPSLSMCFNLLPKDEGT